MGFLPEETRRDEIKFIFLKSVSYNTRLLLVALFLFAAAAAQLLIRNNIGFYMGLAFLACTMILSLVSGYSNIPVRPRKKEFERCSREEFEKVLEINRRSKQWDKSFVDITCFRGAFALIVLVLLVYAASVLLEHKSRPYYARVFLWDFIVLFVPQWLTGVRRILKNAPLIIKVENFLKLASYFDGIKEQGEELEYWLEVAKVKKGELPTDAKLMLKFHEAPDSFFGMQVQMTLNNVQGKDYPYMYCVLIAREEFHLHPKVPKISWLTVEKKTEAGGIDISVIRQKTTRTSGYHTRYSAMQSIFTASLSAARMATRKEPVETS